MKGYDRQKAAMTLLHNLSRASFVAAALSLALSAIRADGADIKVWYPLGYSNTDAGGHRYFAVQTESYKFVYDLGRPSMTELYNLARNPSGGPNLLKAEGGVPGSFLQVLDSSGKAFQSFRSDGNSSVIVPTDGGTVYGPQTRMTFRQAGRVYYQLDVVGIKLRAADGTVAPLTVSQRFHIWPEKFYVETAFACDGDMTLAFAEEVTRLDPGLLDRFYSQDLGQVPVSPGFIHYIGYGEPCLGYLDSSGSNGSVSLVCPNRTSTTTVVGYFGAYGSASNTLNLIHRMVDRDVSGEAAWHAGESRTMYSQRFFSADQSQTAIANDAFIETHPISVAPVNSSYGPLSGISYDNKQGCYRVAMPSDFQTAISYDDYADVYPNYYESARLRIFNTSSPRTVRIKVTRGSSISGSPVWGELMVTDPAGFPLGVPSEQNSRWNDPDPDTFFVCYTSLPVEANQTRDIVLKLIYQNWGQKPLIRMQCQDLYRFDGQEQQWMQSSIGQGENMVYYVQRVSCTVNDARAIDGRPIDNRTTTWRDNCGGWEFLKLASGARPESRGLIYHASGPNMYDFTLTGEMDDGSIISNVRVFAVPANEVTRTFFKIRYDVTKTISTGNIAANLRLFATGDERYGPLSYPNVAYTGANGAVVVQSAGSSFTNRPLGGPARWACTYGASYPVGTGGNRGFVLRSYSARVNGALNNTAAITLNPGSQTRLILTANSTATTLQAGDFFGFELETVAYGDSSSDYTPMVTEATAFAESPPRVTTVYQGSKISDFPARLDIGPDGYADFVITGGRDIIPIEVGGFATSGASADDAGGSAPEVQVEEQVGAVWTPIDQAYSGRDWWQTEYDPQSNSYRHILALHTDGSTRRLRISRSMYRTQMEGFVSASPSVASFALPDHIGGRYAAETGDSPLRAGDWMQAPVTVYGSLYSTFTPLVRYSAVEDAVIEILVDGVASTPVQNLAATGANVWKTIALADVNMYPGAHQVKVVVKTGGCYLDWIEWSLQRPAYPPAEDAALLSEDVPYNIRYNSPAVVQITMRNTGGAVWTAGSYGLWSASEFGSPGWHALARDVPPGDSYTFRFTMPAAPQAVKLFMTRWQMKGPTGLFGTAVVRPQHSTDTVLTYDSAQLVDDDIPARMSAGEIRQIKVSVRNAGMATWKGTDASDYSGLVREDSRFGSSKGGQVLLSAERILPGEDRTFSLNITAPSVPGTYMLRLRMHRWGGTGFFGPHFCRQIQVVADATPPGLPTVQDDGDYTTSASTLHAIWNSFDAQSPIEQWEYAIGTEPTDPGAGYIRNWQSTGAEAFATASGLDLQNGATYYFYVRARNAGGMWSAVGASDGIVAAEAASSVASVKALAEGTTFALGDVHVTGVWPGEVFVQDTSRAAGLKLLWSGEAPDLAHQASVLAVWQGWVEMEPTATALGVTAGAEGAAAPLGMNQGALGWPGAGEGSATGLDNRCLLVRIWGRITYSADGWYLIDDGAGVSDYLSETGMRGVKFTVPDGLAPIETGQFAAVTGVSRADAAGRRWVMPRAASDVAVVP